MARNRRLRNPQSDTPLVAAIANLEIRNVKSAYIRFSNTLYRVATPLFRQRKGRRLTSTTNS